jgi:hypothetical protein
MPITSVCAASFQSFIHIFLYLFLKWFLLINLFDRIERAAESLIYVTMTYFVLFVTPNLIPIPILIYTNPIKAL